MKFSHEKKKHFFSGAFQIGRLNEIRPLTNRKNDVSIYCRFCFHGRSSPTCALP